MAEAQLLIIAIATLLYSLFNISVSNTMVKSEPRVVSSGLPKTLSSVSKRLVLVRNLICHTIGSPECDMNCKSIVSNWKEVEKLVKHLNVLDDTPSIIFKEYFDKVGIATKDDWKREYLRLVGIYHTGDRDALAKHIKEDLL